MKQLSLTARIIAATLACQLLLTGGLVVVALAYARAELLAAFDTSLQGRAMSALALVRYSEDPHPKLTFDAAKLPPPLDPTHPDLYEVRLANGRVLARSAGESQLPATDQAGTRFLDFREGDARYRAIVLRNVAVLDVEENLPDQPAHVTIAYSASTEDIHRRLTALALSIIAVSVILLALASVLAAWSVRRGLLPLRELTAQAGAISVRNWTFQPPPAAAAIAELAPLTSALDTVLARLKESFQNQREFVGNAAHELKTSVAIVKSTLQSLLQRPRTEEDYRAGLTGLMEDCGRLEDLLERMLRLARIEQWVADGVPRSLAVTELVSTCESALHRVRALAEARDIALDLRESPPVHLRADPEDLELIWINLLENAVHHSPPGSRVILRVERGADHNATVAVEDAGPGIPPDELPHIFERFHRGDPSRARNTGGVGLGLAICKALVEAYGGTIEAISSPGIGARLLVHLPVLDS